MTPVRKNFHTSNKPKQNMQLAILILTWARLPAFFSVIPCSTTHFHTTKIASII
ncbi:hypothetical protein E2C01_030472 [Portunus trituberculatus]|uniref:Uncharacterized protein n=1 Tax=Portunus trituberculatus TaxID=210409 RepID=A0A5B7EVE7_PORTR|nr:hypothetical protein [Portunus trituberculatus]